MKYYVVDTFTDEIFKGNSAGVCILEKTVPDEIMQKIAFENNLSETAFVLKKSDIYSLRWFTPTFEIDLCGHATLASAFVVLNYLEPESDVVRFDTMSGILTVERKNGAYEMSFPKRVPERIDVTDEITAALGFAPKELYSERDLYAVTDSVEDILSFEPDYKKLGTLDNWLGIVVTAKGENCDFVSRFFCPELNLEDPVTGSSHSSLVPLWAKKLNKNDLTAKQLSKRGGTLYCRLGEDDVKISGSAALYMHGDIII
ncbi:MAG: PhzF family phenazine biosynthesis protein [Oscillospiraceae bacterium]|nr:PhzF family phenazine biosynthesis protein [Oscillospiraceae bacterium]